LTVHSGGECWQELVAEERKTFEAYAKTKDMIGFQIRGTAKAKANSAKLCRMSFIIK